MNGQTYATGTISATFGLGGGTTPVELTIAAEGTFLLNADPKGNGLSQVDMNLAYQISVSVTGSLMHILPVLISSSSIS